jgi:hypothetical protein
MALLGTVDELPSFWIVGNPNPSDPNSSPYLDLPVCDTTDDDQGAPAVEASIAELQFIEGASIGGSVLNELVASVDVDGAMKVMDAARRGLSCDSTTDAKFDPPLQWAITDQPFPALGDDVYARTFVGTSDDEWPSVHAEIVIIRDGGYIVQLLHFGFDDLEQNIIEDQAIKIVQRVDARIREGS